MDIADWLRRGTRSASIPEFVALDGPQIFDDPYPLYAQLRRGAPIASVRTGGYLITRHADVRGLLTRDDFGNRPSRFSGLHPRFRGTRVAADVAANILPFLDGPEHVAQRRLLSAALRARMRDFLPEVEELASRFLDAAPEDGCDVISIVAAPFTHAVMCRLLGLPEGDGPLLGTLTDHFFRLFAPLTEADVLEEVNRGLEEFRQLLRARREEASPGSLLALMAEPGRSGDQLTDSQIVDSAILIFADGVENVAAGAACVLLAAHRSSEAWEALEAGGEAALGAVGEALRLDSPAQIIPRIAQRDTEVLGHPVRQGMPIFLALGSANRDGDVFDAPDDFRLTRNRSPVLTFGAGRHYCLGADLAEAQIRALASASCQRGYRVAVPADGLRYRRRMGHRWLEELPVRRPTGSGNTNR